MMALSLRILIITSVVQSLGAFAQLSNGVLTLGDVQTSAVTTATVAFTTATAIPVDGKIEVTFPTGFTLDDFAARANPPTTRDRSVVSLSTSAYTEITGLLTPIANTATRIVTITRSGVGIAATFPTRSHAITFQNIKMPTTAGAVGAITVTTKTSADVDIDTVTFTPTLTISECPKDCSSVGTCNTGVCTCNSGYYGDDCATLTPPAFSEALWASRHGESYTIDWTSVATTQPTTTSTYGVDLQQICSCDLTIGLCDVNCCCDQDCSTSVQALFTECLATTNASDVSVGCIASKYIAFTNEYSNLTFTTDDTHTCGQLYNEPSESKYYEVTSLPTAAPVVKSEAKFAVASQESTRAKRDIGVYTPGDNIAGAYTKGASSELEWWIRYLKLPSADEAGACTMGSARFMGSKSDNKCRTRISSLDTGCAAQLSPSNMLEGVKVFPIYHPPSHIVVWAAWSTNTDNTSYSRGLWLNQDDEIVFTNSGYNYYHNSTGLDMSVSGVTSTDVAVYTSGTTTCAGALSSIKYTVVHNGLGNITSISAAVTTADIVAESDGSAEIEQTFDIEFLTDTEASAGKAMVARSGGNNYIAGEPIVAGNLVTNTAKSAVEQNILGLEVQAPGTDGYCDDTKWHTVKVGGSASSCCMVNLTYAELVARCDNTYAPSNYPAQDRIGAYGSADMNRLADWITLATPTTPSQTYRTSPNTAVAGGVISDAPAWDSVTYSCHGVLASTRLTVVTALQGAFTVPQRKIISVSQEYERATWRWTSPNSDGTHDFQQCYHVVTLHEDLEPITSHGFSGLEHIIYPVFLKMWNVDSRTSEFMLVAGITILSFIVVLFLVHAPVESLRNNLQPERILFMS